MVGHRAAEKGTLLVGDDIIQDRLVVRCGRLTTGLSRPQLHCTNQGKRLEQAVLFVQLAPLTSQFLLQVGDRCKHLAMHRDLLHHLASVVHHLWMGASDDRDTALNHG